MSYPYSFDTQDEYLESLNTPMSEEDAEKMILREQYDEEMFERRANGIETESFEDWDLKRRARQSFFENWAKANADAEDIAEARAS